MKITILIVIATIMVCKTTADVEYLQELAVKKQADTSSSCYCGPRPPTTSCEEQRRREPKSPSGMYLIASSNKTVEYVYCNMGTLCGSEGGWTRVGYLDMTDGAQSCPEGTRLYQQNGVRACGRPIKKGGSCATLGLYQSHGIRYTQVCGRVRGYQYRSTDAFDHLIGRHNNINSFYVDGISLTTVSSPRKHLYTFASGYSERNNDRFACPCNIGSHQLANVQLFVGEDYYCESGNPEKGSAAALLMTDDPLWDGKRCDHLEEPCCENPNLPFFHKTIEPTSDNIEAMICEDQGSNDEDVAVDQLEIYIK